MRQRILSLCNTDWQISVTSTTKVIQLIRNAFVKLNTVRAIAIEDDHDRNAKQQEICVAADAVDTGHGVVLVTDMFGGSPSNLSLPACATTGRRILYGANLPMLIKLAKSRDLGVPEAVAAALDAGRKYINALDLGAGA